MFEYLKLSENSSWAIFSPSSIVTVSVIRNTQTTRSSDARLSIDVLYPVHVEISECAMQYQEKWHILNEPTLVWRDAVSTVCVLSRLTIESNVVNDGRLRGESRSTGYILFSFLRTQALRQNCSSTPAWLTKKVKQERNCMVTTEALAGMVNRAPDCEVNMHNSQETFGSKDVPTFWLSNNSASAMTWQSLGSGPPPEGTKQFLVPLHRLVPQG